MKERILVTVLVVLGVQQTLAANLSQRDCLRLHKSNPHYCSAHNAHHKLQDKQHTHKLHPLPPQHTMSRIPVPVTVTSHSEPRPGYQKIENMRAELTNNDDYEIELVDSNSVKPPAPVVEVQTVKPMNVPAPTVSQAPQPVAQTVPTNKPSRWNNSLANTLTKLESEAAEVFSGTKIKNVRQQDVAVSAPVPPPVPVPAPKMTVTAIPVQESLPVVEVVQNTRAIERGQKPTISISPNQTKNIRLPSNIEHVFVTKQDVLATQQDAGTLVLSAKRLGESELFLIDNTERIIAKYHVVVQYDLAKLQQMSEQIAPKMNLQYSIVRGDLIASGTVESEQIQADIRMLVKRFAGENLHFVNKLVVKPQPKKVRVMVSQDGRHVTISGITPEMLQRMMKQYAWLADIPIMQALVNSPEFLQQKKVVVIDFAPTLVSVDVNHQKDMYVTL